MEKLIRRGNSSSSSIRCAVEAVVGGRGARRASVGNGGRQYCRLRSSLSSRAAAATATATVTATAEASSGSSSISWSRSSGMDFARRDYSHRINRKKSDDENGRGGRSRCDAASDTAAADAAAANLEEIAAATAAVDKHPPQRPAFPWRHCAPENLVPRLTPPTPEFVADLHPSRNFEAFLSYVYLRNSFARAYLGNRWKKDFAEEASWCFRQGVAGIISNVYKQPFEEISLEERVDFKFPPTSSGFSGPATDKSKAEDNHDGDDEQHGHDVKDDGGDDGDGSHYCPEVNHMLGRSLRKLYKSAHESGRDQLRIRLETQPLKPYFYHLVGVPFVSRRLVEDNPNRVRDYVHKMVTLRSNWSENLTNIMDFLETEYVRNNGRLETTLRAEVLVVCEEIFQVFDVQTGQLLQGSEDGMPQKVAHLVSFEMTVETYDNDNFPYFPEFRQGNWQIVDIDDLAGAEPWYYNIKPTRSREN